MNEILQETLEKLNSTSFDLLLLNLALAVVLSLFACLAYRLTYSGTAFSKKFMASLAMLTVITTGIMNAISNNVALSLGLVGALSIIRFRTAVKDARDATFLFWCIGIGICCGVSMYIEAVVGSVVVFLLLLCMGQTKKDGKYLLVVRADAEALDQAESAVGAYFGKSAALRVRNATRDSGDLIYELSKRSVDRAARERGKSIVDVLFALDGVLSVDMVRQTDDISR